MQQRYFLFAGVYLPGNAPGLRRYKKGPVLYSGDINTTETNLVRGANIKTRDPKAFIVETTYGDREHPDRKEQEAGFLQSVKETLDDGGKVIVPTFAAAWGWPKAIVAA